ncbi:MAG: UDP-galactopyranose mutase [Mollicutes bacterium]|nr:UDP-galactopyranose mutase [Mollicutes bacterium]
MKYDYLIVGAGLFGSVFAYEMSKLGKKCLVIDKRGHIGGNVFTEEISGINVHKYGPHIFHTDYEDVWTYINQFARFNNFINTPMARYKDEIYNLPFNMNTFSKIWGISSPEEARAMIEDEIKSFQIKSPKNLEEQAISLVGHTIYKKLIKGYTEKQWGRNCTELPSSIIKRIPIRFEYNNNYFNDHYQGIPIGGYTKIIEKLLEDVEVQLNCDYFSNPEELKSMAKRVLFTGMIDEFYDYIYGELEYRSLKFETHVLNINNYQGVAVVNYTEKDIPFTRIIEHKFFEKTDNKETVLSYEFPNNWTKGKEAYYPINDEKNNELYCKYKELAQKEKKFIFGGRLADYSYYDMDDTIKKSLELVEVEKVRGRGK